MGKTPAQKTNVTTMPQAGDTLKSHQGKTVLPDLLSLEQIREYIAKLGDADKAKLGVKVKRDTNTLLTIKQELQDLASKRMQELFGEDLNGSKALGIVWKAAWPTRYYHLDADNNRITKDNGAFDTWEYLGGKGKRKPSWITGIVLGPDGKPKKDKDGNVVKCEKAFEAFELQKDDKGNVTEVATSNGDSDDEDEE